MDLLILTERLGVPIGILAAIFYGLWRVLVWMGNRVVTPITESHIALVRSAEKANTLNSQTLDRIGELLETKVNTLVKIVDQNNKIIDLTSKNHILLNELKKQAEEV